MIRKACIEEKNAIITLIQDSIEDMESKRIHQWDEIYPDEETISADLNTESLFVYTDNGSIKGIVVLNEHQDEEYASINWNFNSGRPLIVHRLCVDPLYQGRGIARQLMAFAENYGKCLLYESIRLDAFIDNSHACRLYERLGYVKVGIVNFRKGKFYCFEKKL